MKEMSERAGDNGGPFDLKAGGLKGWRLRADNADRVLMRPSPGVAVIVPRSDAVRLAKPIAKGGLSPKTLKDEAVLLVMKEPYKQVKYPRLPEGLLSVKLVVLPDAQGGADVTAEGVCADEATAGEVARDVTSEVARANGALVKMATAGLLSGVTAVPEGKVVKAHVHANAEQIAKVIDFLELRFGLPPPPAGAPR
jgi:hypothetical protein